MSRAKIVFMPKVGTENYPMNNVEIIDKYSGWKYDTSGFVESGYVYTDEATSIATINSNYWIKFKPKKGYKFQSVHKSSSSGTSNTGEFDILADGSCVVYPWQSGTATIINNYTVFEVVESAETSYNVNTSLENCTSDSLDYYNENEVVTVNLTCSDNYIFDTIPFITMGELVQNFIVSDDKKTATITFTITSDVSITGVAIHTPHKLALDLEHCTCNYSDSVPDGETNIILTCDTGYEFTGYISYELGYITHTSDRFTQDNTVWSSTLDINTDLSITAHATKKHEQISSFTNLYRVTNQILTDLSKVRFYNTSGSDVQKVDYGSFITNLIKIPFDINDEMIADTGNIQLGDYDSSVQAEILQKYVLCVNIGEIHVDEKYKNVYDYKDVNCILHLPQCENMVLPTEYVMNHTISIEYKIDLYSGNCTVNIYSDFLQTETQFVDGVYTGLTFKENNIVASKTFNIGVKIPFIQEQTNTVVNSLQNIIDNGVKNAFIEVVRNIPYNVNSVFGNETVDFGTLENYQGYIKVSDILLNISATNDEKNEIENLLKSGVYINDNSSQEIV